MNTESEINGGTGPRTISRSVSVSPQHGPADGRPRATQPRRGGRAAAVPARPHGAWQGGPVTYDHVISDVVKVVEAIGAAIMIVGGAWAFADYLVSVLGPAGRTDAYRTLRRRLGQAILLGLEVLIVGDIVRTIIVSPTVESVAVLGMVVVIRIVLSFSLEVEIDGVWPWNLWRLSEAKGGPGSPPPEAP